VEPKYASTRVVTIDGKTVIGLVVSETKKEVVIFDGKEKKTIPVGEIETRSVLKQSSMPERQAAAMSPAGFLDLIEYLAAQKYGGGYSRISRNSRARVFASIAGVRRSVSSPHKFVHIWSSSWSATLPAPSSYVRRGRSALIAPRRTTDAG